MLKPQDIVIALKYGTVGLRSLDMGGVLPDIATDSVTLDPGELTDDVSTRNTITVDIGLLSDRPIGSRWFAEQLGLSQSEIVKANARLQASRLIHPNQRHGSSSNIWVPYRLVTRNMTEWLCHGVRYYLPIQPTGLVRGMATGWSCPFLKSEMVPPEIPMVWEVPHGGKSGEGIEPLYKGAAIAAARDPELYQLLALIDIMRTGRPRELNIAIDLINVVMKRIQHAQGSSRA